MDVTTVADDLVVLHEGTDVPIASPGWRRAASTASSTCRFARSTVRAVHCGAGSRRSTTCTSARSKRAGSTTWSKAPIQRVAPGADPYPEVMNHAAVAEMAAIDPAVVIVKGDLSADGTAERMGGVRGVLSHGIR